MIDLNELGQGKVLLHKCPKCGKVYKYVVAEKGSNNVVRLYTDFGDENVVVGNSIYSLCCGEPVDLNDNLYTLICDDFVADRFFNTKC